MSEQSGGTMPPQTQTTDTSSTASAAKEEASNVASTAKQGGQQVAGTAVEQGRRVADEAAAQARTVLEDARQQVSEQAGSQQQKAASTLRTLGEDLSSMADNSESGMGSQLVRQASDQVQQVAGWLENREPADVIDEVRSFARRRPGAFLMVAAAAGLVAGRLTRGAVDDRRDSSSGSDLGSDMGYAGGPVGTAGTAGVVATDPYPFEPEPVPAPVTGVADPTPVVPVVPPENDRDVTLGADYDPSTQPATPGTQEQWR